ncbi:hypothetical protein CBL_05940 [Carabus blaptoides fortunei]
MSTTNKEIKNQIRNIYNSLCSEVKCSICLDLYVRPVTLTCLHTYCKECYLSLFISLTSPQTILCPICKRAVNRREYFEDQRAQSLVKFLKVYDDEILQKFDQSASDKTDRMKRNEIKFVSAMESANKVQKWINSCMQENTRHSDFFLTSSDSSDSDDIPAIRHTDINNLSKLFEPELARKSTHKKLVVRRTKSLTNIISRVKRKQRKRYSTGNLQLPSEEIIAIEEYDSADVDNNKKEQNNILNLLEEDVLKNFEMEMFGYGEKALDNSTLLNDKIPTKNINKMSKIGESSAKNLNDLSEINIYSKKQKTISDKGNNSARKRSRNTKNDEIGTDSGETTLNSTTPWSRMKTMKKEINKSDIMRKEPKYKHLDVSMEVTKPASKPKKNVQEQMENAVNKQVRNKTVSELSENINSQEIDKQGPILKESAVVNLDDFEAYLSRNWLNTVNNKQERNETDFELSENINPMLKESTVANLDDFEVYLSRNLSQNQIEENTKSKLHIKADTNENSASSDEDDIFSINTQKLNLNEIALKSLDDKTEIQTTANKRNPVKDKIVKDDQDKNRIPSTKIKKAKIMDKNATKDEQTPKQKYKKVKVTTSDKKHKTKMNKERTTGTNEKNQRDMTKKDEKQQLIVNNLDEIQPCSPANVNNYKKPLLLETDSESIGENMETNNLVADVQVHRNLSSESYRSRLYLIDMDNDLKVPNYKRNEAWRYDSEFWDAIGGTYNSSKNIHSRMSVNSKAKKKDKMKDTIVVLEKDAVIDTNCLVRTNDDKISVKSTNQNSAGIMSTSSKEDQLNNTNPTIKRALHEINQNKEISATASQILNKTVMDAENDIITGSETSNVCLDNVPVRRSSRKSNPKANIIKEQSTNKENKGHKQLSILQKAINKWNETSSESSTDVQDEIKASFKSVVDQQNTMVVNLQNSLNLNNTILSQLSNYLTNSESLFSQSSTSGNKDKIEKECSDLDNISDKPNLNFPEYFLSLPNLSENELSKHNILFYNTAIPHLDNINKLYNQIVSLSSQLNNETENFTNIFSKSLLTNCDSSKNNSESSQLVLSTVNKDSTIVNLRSVINKNYSAIINLELAPNKNNSAISDSAKSNLELEVNKTNIVRNISVQTDVLNCPKCSYIFDFNSNDTSTGQNVDILLPPTEFNNINDTDNIRNIKSQTMPILNIKNISECSKHISQASTNNQSSSSSEIKVGKKINRQLFSSSNESENNKKRKYKRIRTPTPDTDSQPMNSKKSKHEKLYHSKLLYRDDLDIEFDSDMTDSNEKNLQKQTKLTGDSEIENYDEYMKKLFVKYDKAIEGEADDITYMEIDEEVIPNNIRTVDERRKMDTRSTTNASSSIETREISNNSRTKANTGKTNTTKNKMTNNTKMRTRSNKGPKVDTQDITAKYVDILEQEFKTAQFTKPEPKAVTKTIQDSIPNSVLDNLLTDISFENAANSTLVGKSADKSQIAAAISFENTANSTIVEKNGEKSQTSMFTTSMNVPNKSTCSSKKADDTCYTHDIIPATMYSEVDNRNMKSRKNFNANITLGIRELDAVLTTNVRDNVEDEDLNNEVANITGSYPLENSIGSDKDIFDDDDNIVESTPQKENPSQRDRSKFELSRNLQNSIVEFTKPHENANSEWLNNIAPPPEFQDTEQRDLNTLLKQQSATGTGNCLTPDIMPMNLSKSVLTSNEKISSQKQDKSHIIKQVLEPVSTVRLSNTKNLKPLVLAQEDKFSPLKIINPSPPPRPIPSGTPKQKSILNYMCTSQKVDSVGRPDTMSKIDYKLSPITGNIPTIYRPNTKETMQCTSQTRNSNFNSISVLNVSRISKNTSTVTSSKELVNKNTSGVPGVETLKYSVCIACTRLKRDETAAILSLTAKLHGRYTKEFSKQVTHLVVAVDQTNKVKDHTIKYVLAIAHGVWVVSFAWIKDCLNHNRYVNEEPYEVLDVSGRPGPRLSRLTRISQPLLKNYVINCADPFISVSKTDLENAIISLGGEIKQSFTELQNEKDKIRLILSEAKVTQDYDQYQNWRAKYRILVVDIEWLSRTVGQYQVASVRPFVLCIEEDIEDLGYPYPLIAQVPETPTQLTETLNIHQH